MVHTRSASVGGRLFRNRNFVPLLVSRNLSAWGDALCDIAIVWFVYSGTRSPLATAGVAVAVRAAPILVGPFAGVFVDRWDRRRTMMAVDAVRAVILAGLAASDYFGLLSPAVAYLAVFLLTSLNMVFGSAFRALLARIVPRDDLASANGLWQSVFRANGFAASAAAGFVVAALGTVASFALDAASFVLGLLGVRMVHDEGSRAAPAAGQPRPSVIAELRAGWSIVWNDSRLRPIALILGCVTIGGATFTALLPVLVFQRLGGGPAALGALEAVSVAGGVLGGFLAGWVAKRFSLGLIFFFATVLLGVGTLASGLSTAFWLTGLGLALVSFAEVTLGAPLAAFTQTHVPDRLLGRAFGVLGAFEGVGGPVSALLGGIAAQAWATGPTVVVAAAVILAAGILVLTQRVLWSPVGEGQKSPAKA